MEYSNLENLKDIDVNGKVFFVRASLNVPTDFEKIENDFRVVKNLETLKFLVEKKAKIIFAGHIGREQKNSLEIVWNWYKKNTNFNIFFDQKTFENFDVLKISEKIKKMDGGNILMFDNLRATSLEKKNDKGLATDIFSLCDFYVNEAFAVSHRKHMSVCALAEKFKKEKRFFGFQYQKEIENIKKIKRLGAEKQSASEARAHKKIFVLGGAKISTKVPMLEKIMEKFDLIILGGACANNFYKKLGYEIGKSKIDEDFSFEEEFFEKIINSPKFFLPNIVVTGNGEKEISEIQKHESILDISPNAFFEIEQDFESSKFVFFNGPIGFYEGGYRAGTEYLLKKLSSQSKYFVAGGGNTISAIFELGLSEKIDFISTGGGALIEKISN